MTDGNQVALATDTARGFAELASMSGFGIALAAVLILGTYLIRRHILRDSPALILRDAGFASLLSVALVTVSTAAADLATGSHLVLSETSLQVFAMIYTAWTVGFMAVGGAPVPASGKQRRV